MRLWPQGDTALHYAAKSGSKRIVKLCMRWGLTLDMQNHPFKHGLYDVLEESTALAEFIVLFLGILVTAAIALESSRRPVARSPADVQTRVCTRSRHLSSLMFR